MNPILAGMISGLVLSLVAFLVVWPTLGRGFLPVFGRVAAAMLGKLAVVAGLILLVHWTSEGTATMAFGASITVTVVVLLLVQASVFSWKLGRAERDSEDDKESDESKRVSG